MRDGSKRQRFERLLRPEFDALYRTARRVIGSAALAEEAVQEACLKAFARFDPANEPDRFRSWMFRILMNQAIDARRRHLRDSDRIDSLAHPELVADVVVSRHPLGHLEAKETQHALDRSIAALLEDLRAVVALVLIEEMSYAEAAECLDLSEDLVRSRLSRARLQLRTMLADVRDTNVPARHETPVPIVAANKRARP